MKILFIKCSSDLRIMLLIQITIMYLIIFTVYAVSMPCAHHACTGQKWCIFDWLGPVCGRLHPGCRCWTDLALSHHSSAVSAAQRETLWDCLNERVNQNKSLKLRCTYCVSGDKGSIIEPLQDRFVATKDTEQQHHMWISILTWIIMQSWYSV